MADSNIYYNEFFEGTPNLSGSDLKAFLEERRRHGRKPFVEKPLLQSLTESEMWKTRAKFYFLPFLINCYRFTRKNKLPHFAIPVSPTCMFYRDRLHLRNFMDTIWNTLFECMDMCIPKNEPIMLMVEKRFHIVNPVDGGTQQLYNMLWDYDLTPVRKDVYLPPTLNSRLGVSGGHPQGEQPISWNWDDLNPDMPSTGLDLCRRTLWLQDDLHYLCRRYDLDGECHYPEIIDLSNIPEEKQDRYAKTAREFYFKVFTRKDVDEPDEPISSDSDLDPDEDDDFDFDSTQSGMLDSTLNFEEDDEEMKKIIAFFAKMPKVTGLVQGMLDMLAALTRILPLVVVKIDDPKLKDSLTKTIDIINLGMNKVLKICAFLGIKVQLKQSAAINEIVKNRFKKDKKDFLEYEIDELNKSLDALENVDSDENQKPPKGQVPIYVKPNHLYPQKMSLRGKPKPPPIVVTDVPPAPPPPPHPPKPEPDPSESELENTDKPNNAKPEPPKIPSVMPPPPNKPVKGEHGVKC